MDYTVLAGQHAVVMVTNEGYHSLGKTAQPSSHVINQ